MTLIKSSTFLMKISSLFLFLIRMTICISNAILFACTLKEIIHLIYKKKKFLDVTFEKENN